MDQKKTKTWHRHSSLDTNIYDYETAKYGKLYFVQFQRKGFGLIKKGAFRTIEDAREWRDQELVRLANSRPIEADEKRLLDMPLYLFADHWFKTYRRHYTGHNRNKPAKKVAANREKERFRLRRVLYQVDEDGKRRTTGDGKALFRPLAVKPLARITSADIRAWEKERRAEKARGGKPIAHSTVDSELNTLRALFADAATHFGLPLENPVAAILKGRKAGAGESRRDRPWRREGEAVLLKAIHERVRKSRTQPEYLPTMVVLAVETGMRLSDMIEARWDWIRNGLTVEADRIPYLVVPARLNKEGRDRQVFLTPRALVYLRRWQQTLGTPDADSPVFPGITSANAVSMRFGRLIREAENVRLEGTGHRLHDLHFHDLRHWAVAKFLKPPSPTHPRLGGYGLSLEGTISQVGHRDEKLIRQIYYSPDIGGSDEMRGIHAAHRQRAGQA